MVLFSLWAVVQCLFLFLVRLAEASSTVVCLFSSSAAAAGCDSQRSASRCVSLTDKHLLSGVGLFITEQVYQWDRYWFLKMTGKSVKDIDRYQAVLTSLLALEENKFCADCHAKGKIHIPQHWTNKKEIVRNWVYVQCLCMRGLGRPCVFYISLVGVMSDSWTNRSLWIGSFWWIGWTGLGCTFPKRLVSQFIVETVQVVSTICLGLIVKHNPESRGNNSFIVLIVCWHI